MWVAGGLSSGIFSVKIYNNFELENVALPIIFCLNGSDLIKFAQKSASKSHSLCLASAPNILKSFMGGGKGVGSTFEE